MNLPNIITLTRIILIPVFILVFWSGFDKSVEWAMLIVGLAGLSDVADGYLARKLNMVTKLGKVLDPLADKFMIVTALTSLFLVNLVPFWLLLLIVVKEVILVLGSGFVVFRKQYEVSANSGGKIAAVTIYAAIFAVAFNLPGKVLFLYLASIMAIISLFNYLHGYLMSNCRGTKC